MAMNEPQVEELLQRARLAALSTTLSAPLSALMAEAARLRDQGHGATVSYSRKVFIPLTRLCRDVCHYCTFATTPSALPAPYLTPDQVLAIARAGAAAGCREALFTLGDKPELRYQAARDALARLGYRTTIEYLTAMCALVLKETSLLPHANPGVMSADEITSLRAVSVSQGVMLESSADRLCERGGPHFGSPDKQPRLRLGTIDAAGRLAVPFTSGILIGIGETRDERIESLLALHALHQRHGHLQEIIIQNFRAKPKTLMAGRPDPELEELAWTIAVARILFGPTMNIQAPPNLSPGEYVRLIDAGINDWGGVSPVTPDHVNPEAPWPHLDALRAETARGGKVLVERLAIYPSYALDARRWVDPALVAKVWQAIDGEGFARSDDWTPGATSAIPIESKTGQIGQTRQTGRTERTGHVAAPITQLIAKASAGDALEELEIVTLFRARGDDYHAVCVAADALRSKTSGEVVRYVVNRNINYTNVCSYKCSFCAFSKGRHNAQLRGVPYDLAHDEIARRVKEAWSRGATEVCMQGGIHPDYTGDTYLAILKAVKAAEPAMHVHAFSPLEVTHGAATLGMPIDRYLEMMRDAGLGTLPGTAAEILDDEIRRVICPDKLTTEEWLGVIETAHRVGMRTTATIMFGHVERYEHWARHLLRIRALQARTGGFTEFVPLPFVHMEAPMYLKGGARMGPTFRESVLMHAVARLALHPVLTNIQTSWVKMGPEGVRACLTAGANDLGGTLTNESISRAAGTQHGQEMSPEAMDALIGGIGRVAAQRTTAYGVPSAAQSARSYGAAEAAEIVLTPLKRRGERKTIQMTPMTNER